MNGPKLTPVAVVVCVLGGAGLAGGAAVLKHQSGVVVEELGRNTELGKSGVKVGDELLSWQRQEDSPTAFKEYRGEFKSVFDWLVLELEQAPRGTVELQGRRGGENRVFTVAPGNWQVEVRPQMSEELLTEYLRGREHFEAGEILKTATRWREVAARGDSRLYCWILLRLGNAWSELEEWEKAQSVYREALAEADEPGSQVVLWHALGEGYAKRADFDQARDAYERAREIQARTSGQVSLILARSLHSLGNVASEVGDLAQATEFFQRSLAIRQQLAPGSLEVTSSLNNLGIVAANRGDLARATEFFQRALAIREKLDPNSIKVARCLNNLGIMAAMRGDLARATDLHQRALVIEQKLAPDSLDVAWNLNNLGLVARKRGNPTRATELLQRSLVIKEKLTPGSLTVADSLSSLGLVAMDRGDLDGAADLHQSALAIERKLAPGSLSMATSLSSLGRVALARGDPVQAKDFFQRSLVIRQKLAPDSAPVAELLHDLGLLHRLESPHRPGIAADFFRRAIHTVESQLMQLGGAHDVRAGFRAQYHQYYRHTLEVELELGKPAIAFHTLERSRARSFLEQLAERDTVFTADIPPDLDRQRRSIANRFNRIHRDLAELDPRHQAEKIEDFHQQLRQLRGEAKGIEEQIRRASSRLAALQYPRPLDLEAARAALDPGTLMLSYSVGEASTVLFAVSRQHGLRVETLAISEQKLRDQVKRFRQLIVASGPHHRGQAPLEASGRQLYTVLIEPVADLVAANQRLLMVADGPLHTLPWSALVGDTGTGESRYLVEWKPLHSVLSATVYAELKKNRHRDEAPVPPTVLFGDPRYPPRPAKRTLDKTSAELVNIPDADVRAATERGFDFRPLPYTRLEVEQIAQLYPAAKVYLGPEATETRAKALDKSLRIVHFATHGILDDRLPMNSAVVLTIPEEFSEGSDNGLLHAWEIFESVRLDADLVVLSACDAALGEEQRGEGLISLTRAFQFAGARTTAATLWKVADQTTAALMERFYRHLRAGKTKDEALRLAQIELIRAPIKVRNAQDRMVGKDASRPYYWAAFQIHGDWQ